MVTRPDVPGPRLRPPLDAPVLFAGRVLTVETVGRVRRVRFVTDSSWRPPLPDTVTVEYGDDAPCASFTAGAPYLVGAVGRLDALRLPRCGQGVGLVSAALPPWLHDVGTVAWRAPPLGQRPLDRLAIRVGERAAAVGGGDTLSVLLHTGTEAIRLEIADLVPTLRLESGHLRLPPGLYHYRVTYADGAVVTSYVDLRCEQRWGAGECSVGRNFLGRR